MGKVWERYWWPAASRGIGKSTLAANLAVLVARAGKDVLLVDADPQETTATWAAARGEQAGELAPVTTVTIVGKQIRDELRRLADKYPVVIVDAGARDTSTQRAALSVANLVLLPFLPAARISGPWMPWLRPLAISGPSTKGYEPPPS
ncbi:AAA family ATPase [Paeniroseomonas aquatica]|uniref:AAA family ATPase n=1 Tax=Paeniroseomonas aquatica TaxID=373043 RepID=UPI0036172EF7